MFGRATLIVAASAALFAAGCSATAAPSTAKPTAAPTAAGTPHSNAIPQTLQGKYKARISNSSVSTGEWPMVVGATDVMVTNPNPGAEPFSLDMVDVTADRMTFRGSAECTPGQPNREGVYSYTYAGSDLKFTVIDDLCLDRKNMLTAAAWVRQQ